MWSSCGTERQVSPEDTVVVLGGGTIGLCSLAGAKLTGAGRVIVSCGYPQQSSLSKSFGADDVVDYRRDDVVEEILMLTDDEGADVVIECVGGTASTISQAIRVAKKRGRIVVAGGFSGSLDVEVRSIYRTEMRLMGSSAYSLCGHKPIFDIALEVMDSGKFDFQSLVTHKFPLDKINEAFETAADKDTGSVKVEIVF